MKQPQSPPRKRYTEADFEESESRVRHAREGAARSALSAAQSLDRAARAHDEVAELEEAAIDRDARPPDTLQESVKEHRAFAAEDRTLAARKRKEADDCFSSGDPVERPEP